MLNVCCYCQFQALDTFNTAVVSPIYYAMFTTLTIFASAIMFKVHRNVSTGELIPFYLLLIWTILLSFCRIGMDKMQVVSCRKFVDLSLYSQELVCCILQESRIYQLVQVSS